MFGVKKIDIFFLDVEGSELEAIQGIDFKQIEILHFVIECAVEHEVKNKQFLAILKENGYVWVSGDFNQHWELKKD